MAVEGNVLKFKVFLITVFVDECCLKFAFSAGTETLYFYLLCKIYAVSGNSLEDGFLCAPVDCELLVAAIVLKVVDLVL